MWDKHSTASYSSHDPLNEGFIASEGFSVSSQSFNLSQISEIPDHGCFEIETPPLFAKSKDYPFPNEVRSEPGRLAKPDSNRLFRKPGRLTRKIREVEEEKDEEKEKLRNLLLALGNKKS